MQASGQTAPQRIEARRFGCCEKTLGLETAGTPWRPVAIGVTIHLGQEALKDQPGRFPQNAGDAREVGRMHGRCAVEAVLRQNTNRRGRYTFTLASV